MMKTVNIIEKDDYLGYTTQFVYPLEKSMNGVYKFEILKMKNTLPTLKTFKNNWRNGVDVVFDYGSYKSETFKTINGAWN